MSIVKKDYYDNGNLLYVRYYHNNLSHREDGPCYVEYDDDGSLAMENWMINGKYHRVYGPAVIIYNRHEHNYEKWFYMNINYTYEAKEWLKENNFKSWKNMSEGDFNQMWMELL